MCRLSPVWSALTAFGSYSMWGGTLSNERPQGDVFHLTILLYASVLDYGASRLLLEPPSPENFP